MDETLEQSVNVLSQEQSTSPNIPQRAGNGKIEFVRVKEMGEPLQSLNETMHTIKGNIVDTEGDCQEVKDLQNNIETLNNGNKVGTGEKFLEKDELND